MNKHAILLVVVFFFINGLFLVTFSPVFASEITTDSWSTKTSMKQSRYGLGVIAVDNKIYAIGGNTADSYPQFDADMLVGTTEQYDPGSDTWVTLKSMPTPRAYFAIAAYQNKIYCIGGVVDITSVSMTSWPWFENGTSWVNCGVTEVYDTVTDSWSTKMALPVSGSVLQAHVVDGKIFVLAGQDLFMYDPVADFWTQKTSSPYESWVQTAYDPNEGIAAVVVEDRILFSEQYSEDINCYTRCIVYDPKIDVWMEEKIEPLDWGDWLRYRVACITDGLYTPQKIYVFGQRSAQSATYVYDLDGSWSTAKAVPTWRFGFGVGVVEGVLYVIGGFTYGGMAKSQESLGVNERYVPIGYSKEGYSPEASDSFNIQIVDPSSSSNMFLTVFVVVAIVLTVTGVLFFYFRRRTHK